MGRLTLTARNADNTEFETVQYFHSKNTGNPPVKVTRKLTKKAIMERIEKGDSVYVGKSPIIIKSDYLTTVPMENGMNLNELPTYQ